VITVRVARSDTRLGPRTPITERTRPRSLCARHVRGARVGAHADQGTAQGGGVRLDMGPFNRAVARLCDERVPSVGQDGSMSEADEATVALGDMLAALGTTLPRGWAQRRGGASAAATGTMATPLNRVIGEALDADLDGIAVLAQRLADDGLPHMIESRPGATALEDWCRNRGMTSAPGVPLMTCTTAHLNVPSDTAIGWRSLTAAEMPAHVDVASAGYGMDRAALAGLDVSTLFDESFGAGLIAELDGVPACTGISIVAGEWVGVFVIATLAAFRRRGLGAALTAKLVTDAVERNGVSRALLQSSEMGKPVYESLGFETIEVWTRWS
jgi:GNAT superfamily N-acetyltransferase